MTDYLARRVVAESGCALELGCVAYDSLPGVPGIVTAESPEDQGS